MPRAATPTPTNEGGGKSWDEVAQPTEPDDFGSMPYDESKSIDANPNKRDRA